jgi:hypothetical protein
MKSLILAFSLVFLSQTSLAITPANALKLSDLVFLQGCWSGSLKVDGSTDWVVNQEWNLADDDTFFGRFSDAYNDTTTKTPVSISLHYSIGNIRKSVKSKLKLILTSVGSSGGVHIQNMYSTNHKTNFVEFKNVDSTDHHILQYEKSSGGIRMTRIHSYQDGDSDGAIKDVTETNSLELVAVKCKL